MTMYKDYLVRVQLVREKSKPLPIMSPQEAIKTVGDEMEKFDREYLVCAHLNSKNQLISLEEVSKGTLTHASISGRELFKAAILSNAASVIIFHNHPSGSCEPSDSDIKTTLVLKQSGELLGIPVIDHIICGQDKKYYSFKQQGKI